MPRPTLISLLSVLAVACATAPQPKTAAAPPAPPAAAPTLPPPPTAPALRLPTTVKPIHYAAELTVRPAEPGFTAKVDIEVELAEATSLIWLNAIDLEIQTAAVTAGGKTVDATPVGKSEDFIGLQTPAPIGPGPATLHLAYRGKLLDRETLGLFREKDGDLWYAYTHFEATDARRVYPCFDEPAFKATWQLTLHVPEGNLAVSNVPVLREAAEPDGMHLFAFQRTPRLSSYLVAFGVGPFDVVDAGKAGRAGTPVRIVVPKGHAGEVTYAAQIAGPLLAKLEDYFDIPYPFGKMDCLVIPVTVGFGAMENPGLVTYAAAYLYGRPETDTIERRRDAAVAIAHEFAHQWFGDLVTMQWWDDLWLNESFATWMETKIVEDWEPGWPMAQERTMGHFGAISADSLLSARRIRQPILSKNDIVDAFDGITYEKGGSVIDMFESWVGPAVFRRGVHQYLLAHAQGNATARDFVDAISAASGKNVSEAFNSFLDQPGVPLVQLSLACAKDKVPTLELSQRRYLPAGSKAQEVQTWKVPICVRAAGQSASERTCGLLEAKTGTLMLEAPVGSCPAWVVPNAGAHGYYLAEPDTQLIAGLAKDGGRSLTIPERMSWLQNLGSLLSSAELPADQALAWAPRLADDQSRYVAGIAAGLAGSIRDDLVPDPLRPNYARFIRKSFGKRARKLGLTPKKNETEDEKLLRGGLVGLVAEDGEDPALVAEATRIADALLSGKGEVDPELTRSVLVIAARHGDAALWERVKTALLATRDIKRRRDLLSALGSFKQPELLDRSVQLLIHGQVDAREGTFGMLRARRGARDREVLYQAVKTHWDALAAKLPGPSLQYLPYLAVGFCDQAHHQETAAFFGPRMKSVPGGPHILAQVLERQEQCMALRTRQEPAVASFLKKY